MWHILFSFFYFIQYRNKRGIINYISSRVFDFIFHDFLILLCSRECCFTRALKRGTFFLLWFSEKVLRVKLEEIYVVSKAEYAYEISSNRCLRELSRSWERAGCTYSQSSTCLSPTLFLLNFTRRDLTLTFIETFTQDL